jgi:flavodoxin
MHATVVYDSWFGNTERLAHAIAGCLGRGHAEVRHVTEVLPRHLAASDLVFIGGPTHRRGASPAMRSMLRALPAGSWSGVRVAVFDTRYRMPVGRSGSAARDVARELRRDGCHPVAMESVLVEGPRDELPEVEVARAAAWARSVWDKATGPESPEGRVRRPVEAS